jgi:hypothetical protein
MLSSFLFIDSQSHAEASEEKFLDIFDQDTSHKYKFQDFFRLSKVEKAHFESKHEKGEKNFL